MAPFATNCNGNMCVYFVNRVRSSLDKIELDNENWEILSERSIDFPFYIHLYQKSVQDDIIAKKVFTEQNNTFNWEIILFPLEDQKQTYRLKQHEGVRYDFSNKIWSLSGEYFYLLNHDAMGMDRFESLVDLFAYPKTEWPVKLQYDVFHKDGGYAFSFDVDFIYHDDGSYSSEDVFWIPGDRIFIASTFYNANLDSYHSKERLIDVSGEIIGEWSYDGFRKQYLSCEFDAEGVYYGERKNDLIHLMYKQFASDKVIDHGPVLDFTTNAFILPHPGPDGDLLLLTDHEQTLRIIEVVE